MRHYTAHFKNAEVICGVGVAVIGLIAIIIALLLPIRSENVSTYKNGQFVGQYHQNVWLLQELGALKTGSILGTVAVLVVVVAMIAALHAAHHLPIDLLAMWGATILLAAAVYVCSTWTSYLFLPTALLAVFAAILASVYQLLSSSGSRGGSGGNDKGNLPPRSGMSDRS